MARFTQAWIDRQKPKKGKRYIVRVPEVPGLFLRVSANGIKTFTVVARPKGKKPQWHELLIEEKKGKPYIPAVLGSHTLEQIADSARAAVRRIKSTQPAFPQPDPEPESFKATAERWVEHHVTAKRLRSKSEIERCLSKYVYPVWEERPFTSIKRLDVATLLDSIVKESGARQANYVLAIVRGLMNWYAARANDYVSPIVKGMARPVPSGGKRDRVLTDDELRILWPVLGERGTYGGILKLALLSGQRADKLATMKWSDVSLDGVWRIATEEREKGNAGTLALPEMALDVIRAQPHIENNPYVFPGRDRKREEGVDPAELARPFAGWSPCKDALDKKILEALRKAAAERGESPKKVTPPERWVVHDLRRTAKSLMMRAGLDRFHAERVLGHAIPGVEGVYDRHDYAAERKHALAALAGLLSRILNSSADNNVVELRAQG